MLSLRCILFENILFCRIESYKFHKLSIQCKRCRLWISNSCNIKRLLLNRYSTIFINLWHDKPFDGRLLVVFPTVLCLCSMAICLFAIYSTKKPYLSLAGIHSSTALDFVGTSSISSHAFKYCAGTHILSEHTQKKNIFILVAGNLQILK